MSQLYRNKQCITIAEFIIMHAAHDNDDMGVGGIMVHRRYAIYFDLYPGENDDWSRYCQVGARREIMIPKVKVKVLTHSSCCLSTWEEEERSSAKARGKRS